MVFFKKRGKIMAKGETNTMVKSTLSSDPINVSDIDSVVLRLLERCEYDQAWNEILHYYKDDVFRFCLNTIFKRAPWLPGWYQIAEDAAQETFMGARKSMSGFKGKSSISTWLKGIASFKCIDEINRQEFRNEVPVDDILSIIDTKLVEENTNDFTEKIIEYDENIDRRKIYEMALENITKMGRPTQVAIQMLKMRCRINPDTEKEITLKQIADRFGYSISGTQKILKKIEDALKEEVSRLKVKVKPIQGEHHEKK